jgi:hypothetical protein
MAVSPAHRFGQIIGEVLEASVLPLLAKFARKHDLYLDRKGPRPARAGTKVTWTDKNGNEHDLDFVLERGGTAVKIGQPVAFIETAWRRYTRHSRNKAQEIQAAILPLVEKHRGSAPFVGVILAGVFTEGALTQLKSERFTVVYLPYETILKAFRRVGIEAAFDEDSADAEFAKKVKTWTSPAGKRTAAVAKALTRPNRKELEEFLARLEAAVVRQIASIRILPLHGAAFELPSVGEAIAFVQNYKEDDGRGPLVGYEIQIRYNSGDSIDGRFATKDAAIGFLRSYQNA